MSLVGRAARNHPNMSTSHDVDDRATVRELFDPLHARFQFTVDAAAARHNTKLPRFWDIKDDGLLQDWNDERVWCNPPYSSIAPWVEKALASSGLTVLLLPANRTEQGWWQDLIEPNRDRGGRLTVEFIRGRQRFLAAGQTIIGANERPPFGVCLAVVEPGPPIVKQQSLFTGDDHGL